MGRSILLREWRRRRLFDRLRDRLRDLLRDRLRDLLRDRLERDRRRRRFDRERILIVMI